MKKNCFFKYIVAGLIVLFCITSCNEANFLDLTNPNGTSEKDFWKTHTDAMSALATCYRPITYQINSGYYGSWHGWIDLTAKGDDIYAVLQGEDDNDAAVVTFKNSPASTTNIFGALYQGIQRANELLTNIDKIPATELKDDERSMMKGEALFLRAYQYFLLVNNYKEVPLRLNPSANELMKGPAKESEIWAQVETDLKAALNCNLPIKRDPSQNGRVEKGAVVFLLGKVYATEHKYDEARQMLAKLMPGSIGGTDSELGTRYELMQDFADNFKSTTEFNKESIFELNYNGTGPWGDDNPTNFGCTIAQFTGPVCSTGYQKIFVSPYAVDEFLSDVDQVDHATTHTKFDKRMYASLFFDPKECGDIDPQSKESAWYGKRFTMDSLWIHSKIKFDKTTIMKYAPDGKGRYILKKYTGYYVDSPSGDNMSTPESAGNNLRIMRYDEALLLYAEACAQTSKIDYANGAINMIRSRAGLIHKNFGGKEELMKEIEFEDFIEFFAEGHRFDDLKRWYTYDQIHAIFRAHHKQGACPDETDKDGELINYGGDNFQPKHLYYPIPESELQNNPNMRQNSAWQ